MVLVIDIGNTNIVFGVYDGENLVEHYRLGTDIDKTVDEYAILTNSLLSVRKLSFENIDGAIISSVVPPLLVTFQALCEKYMGVKPIVVEPGIRTGMPILYENPAELGADRIVNAVAGYERYKKALIVIDFGTATTFDYVTPEGEFAGGAIVPGLMISLEALFEKASKLPRVELAIPKSVIGKNTIQAMQAGIIFGYASLVDGIVKKMKDEVKTEPYVVATGGFSKLISRVSKTVDEVDEFLTLRGLKILYDKNKDLCKRKTKRGK
ncbi:MAG: type III pantothenate kinase [Desulfobacterota bacterium]|nr:type III pantothenate kinase [Thermodesulfobacteriota bacterium]MDW8001553.1 type III pantothenate kinase [Deltaproteobacteria bacterium]